MTNTIKVIIYDAEGNIILRENIASPFVGLQAGETFWYGSGNNKSWSKVISISYGLDTSEKSFVVEMVIEKTTIKSTKQASTIFTKMLDLGVVEITDSNPSWESEDKRLSIGVGCVNKNKDVINFSLTFNTGSDFKSQRRDELKTGEEIMIETPTSTISCVLLGTKSNIGNSSGYTGYWKADLKLIEKIR